MLTEGAVHHVPEAVRELLPGAPETYEEHEELLVVGPEGEEAPVDWRWEPDDDEGDGLLHAATLDGLAAGLAWAAGAWHRRFEVAVLLAEPERVAELSAARDFEG